MELRKLVSIKFGSHLYGTATPQSDVDLKSVYVPSADAILLQKVKGSLSNQRPKNAGEKNYAGEIDEESYSLQRFLGLAAEGQTVALDILFAPEWSMTAPPPLEWREVVANRHRLITKKSAAFVGYCRQQANKYGIKGSRMTRSYTADSIEPTIPELAEIIASGLISDSKAGRLGAIGIDQVQEAIDAREQGRKLQGFAYEQLVTLTLRKLINKVG